MLVIWLDPINVDLYGPQRKTQVSYDPGNNNSYQNSFATAYANVTGSVELLVLPFVSVGVENYQLSVVPTAEARGGVVYFGPDGDQVESLTASLRQGVDQYNLSFGSTEAALVARPVTDPMPAVVPRGAGGDIWRVAIAIGAYPQPPNG